MAAFTALTTSSVSTTCITRKNTAGLQSWWFTVLGNYIIDQITSTCMSTRTSLRLSALKPIWFLVSHASLISTSESNVANFKSSNHNQWYIYLKKWCYHWVGKNFLNLTSLQPFSSIRDFGKQNTAETFPKFPPIVHVLNRSDPNPSMTAR